MEKELRSGGANKTTLRNTINMLAASTSIVACYNYTGTPYVKKQVLPEVVYAYELPYDGAREMLLVEDVDNKKFLTGLFNAMYDELPAPKIKKKK